MAEAFLLDRYMRPQAKEYRAMSQAHTESQKMLAEMVIRLLADVDGFETRRRRLTVATPNRLALWPHLAAQGIIGAAFSEDAGGFGGTMRDLSVVMEVIGQSLVVEPVLAVAICGRILASAGYSDQLLALIAGERILVFAHTEGFDPFSLPITIAQASNGEHRLSGTKFAVRHADLAHGFVVTAALSGAAACFLVEAGAPGLQYDNFRMIDAASAATMHFVDTPAKFLADEKAVGEALLWSMTGLAAETSGIINAVNKATFEYLRTRKQFGAALASFQALQHRAADMFVAAEEVRVMTSCLIEGVDVGAASRFALASATKALTDEAGRKIGHEAVQMHGGMGVSDELNISHYLRRLAAIRAELGSADIHRARFLLMNEDSRDVA